MCGFSSASASSSSFFSPACASSSFSSPSSSIYGAQSVAYINSVKKSHRRSSTFFTTLFTWIGRFGVLYYLVYQLTAAEAHSKSADRVFDVVPPSTTSHIPALSDYRGNSMDVLEKTLVCMRQGAHSLKEQKVAHCILIAAYSPDPPYSTLTQSSPRSSSYQDILDLITMLNQEPLVIQVKNLTFAKLLNIMIQTSIAPAVARETLEEESLLVKGINSQRVEEAMEQMNRADTAREARGLTQLFLPAIYKIIYKIQNHPGITEVENDSSAVLFKTEGQP